MKNLRVKRLAQSLTLGASMLATGFFAFSAQATQTVNPFTAATGGTNMNGTTVPFTSNAVTFFGRYNTTTNAAESGLGVKVKYDSTKVTVAVTEEYEGCRIATAQNQVVATPANSLNSQVVMGWIDTSIRTTPSAGAVGWPNVAEPADTVSTKPCLDPGSINATPTGSATDQKLFKIVATRTAGFTTGTTPISIVSDGNFSYAGASPGFDAKGFTIDAAAAGSGLTLAASNPIVSRKTHGGAGTFDIPLTSTNIASPTIEPRQATAGAPHRVVYTFTTVPAASGHTVEVRNAGGSVVGGVTSTTSVVGSSVIVELSGVAANQRVNVTLNAASAGGAFTVPVGFLLGDVNNTASVSVGDINAVRAVSGQATNASNFRTDLNVSGAISVGDINLVRSTSGATLAP